VAPGEVTTYTITLKDASGSRYSDSFQYTFDAVMIDTLPPGAVLVPGSLSVTGNGSVFTTTSAAELEAYGLEPEGLAPGSMSIIWAGTLGGTRLDDPDAVITYAVTLPLGCASNEPTLLVQQEMITDTWRNEGDPFLWPKHSRYGTATTACVPVLYLPIIHR
jgi:uncharacterized repeat protein (TIGR01451 family)